jgi:pimeloyl-ACP methyl ester carboxylesterase
MTESTVTSERGTTHYWVSRCGNEAAQTLVFLHGLTADHTLFEKQTEYFSENYNLIVWDTPAHGKSRPYKDFSYPNAAAELNEILINCNVDSAVFIGQSMGGFITQSFLRRFPEKVKAFVAIDSCPFGECYYSKSDKWWLRHMEWMCHLFTFKLLRKSVAKQCAATQPGYENMLTALSPYNKDELCHLYGIGYAGFLDDNCDLKINCPLLILVGEHDTTGKVMQYNKEWSKNTGIPLHVIKNAAHNSNIDNPKDVNELIEKFLKSL